MPCPVVSWTSPGVVTPPPPFHSSPFQFLNNPFHEVISLNVQDLPKGCDTPKECHLVVFWWLWVVQNPPFSCLSDLMMDAGRHGKDLATTLRPFLLAGLVLLIIFPPNLPLFWCVPSQPPDSWRYPHLSREWKRSRGTLEPRGAEDDQAGLCYIVKMKGKEPGHVGTVTGWLTTIPCTLGTCGFPDWMLY